MPSLSKLQVFEFVIFLNRRDEKEFVVEHPRNWNLRWYHAAAGQGRGTILPDREACLRSQPIRRLQRKTKVLHDVDAHVRT
jgi:dGTP triphosphohydrolase